MKAPTKTILVLRLSSLGDLLLSTAFLESIPPGVAVDWVVNQKFAFVLEGHPRIRKLYLFESRQGLGAWIKLMRELAQAQYHARVDLHATLRTRIARIVFALHGQTVLNISKERLRSLLYFSLKKWVPQGLRPTPYWKRFSKMGIRVVKQLGIPAQGGEGTLHPPRFPLEVEEVEAKAILAEYQLQPKSYLAVMPASRWQSKEWGAERYFEAIRALYRAHSSLASTPVLVLGRESDRASTQLLVRLKAEGIPTRSGLSEEEFRVTAFLLSQAILYLGGDTGLAHLAEAVGTRAVVIFGPTQPEVGFGPWREGSLAVRSPVICSPCSKDGRPCYRFFQPYECFKQIHPDQVASDLAGLMAEGRG